MKFDEVLKKARDMQQRIEDARESLKDLTATGESGGGVVKITMNGSFEALRVDIAPAALAEERAVLEDLVAAAINDAAHRVEHMQQERMGSVAKQVGLPPGVKLPI